VTGDAVQSSEFPSKAESAKVAEVPEGPLPSCEAFENGPADDGICKICQEKLEKFLHHESEEWRWNNAVRINDKVCVFLLWLATKKKKDFTPPSSSFFSKRHITPPATHSSQVGQQATSLEPSERPKTRALILTSRDVDCFVPHRFK